MSGKGSGRRPTQVDESTVEANWAAIFNKGKTPEPEQTEKEVEDGE